MKFQETYKITLVLLATLLAVIGTTATVVHADEPPNEPGDAPGDLLNDQQMTRFNGLPEGIQQQLEEYVLPILDTEGFTTEEKSDILAHIVDLEHQVRVLTPFVVPRDDLLPGGRCILAGPTFYQNGTTVSSYASVNCTYAQQVLHASAAISKWGEREYGVANRRPLAKSASAIVVRPYSAGRWDICGGFHTEPMANPQRDWADKPTDTVCKGYYQTN